MKELRLSSTQAFSFPLSVISGYLCLFWIQPLIQREGIESNSCKGRWLQELSSSTYSWKAFYIPIIATGALDIKNCNSPALIGYLLIKGSPGITGSWIPRAPMKGFRWHLHVGSSFVFRVLSKADMETMPSVSFHESKRSEAKASHRHQLVKDI